MTPDLPLAKACARAVLDRIEKDRVISSDGITEAIFAKLLYAHTTVADAPKPESDREVVLAARQLLAAICADPNYTRPSKAVIDTAAALDKMLRERHS